MRRSEIKLVKLPVGSAAAFGAVYDNFANYAYKQRAKYQNRVAPQYQGDRRAYAVLWAIDAYRSLAGKIKVFDDLLWNQMIYCHPNKSWLEWWHASNYVCKYAKFCPHCRFSKAKKAIGHCMDRWHDLRVKKQYYIREEYFEDTRAMGPICYEIGRQRAALIRGAAPHVTLQTLFWTGPRDEKRLCFRSIIIPNSPKRYNKQWTIVRPTELHQIIKKGLHYPVANLLVTPEELFQLRHANYYLISPSRS